MLKAWRGRPHVKIVEALVHSAQMLVSRCCWSANPHLSCLVVTALLIPSKRRIPSEPSHSREFEPSAHVGSGAGSVSILGAVERPGTRRP